MPHDTDLNPLLARREDASSPVGVVVGTMNFGKRTPEAEANRVVRRAMERGLRFFDTANVYNNGESERILGRALGSARNDCFIATKVGLAGIPAKRRGGSRAPSSRRRSTTASHGSGRTTSTSTTSTRPTPTSPSKRRCSR